jgi:hypothetical protein
LKHVAAASGIIWCECFPSAGNVVIGEWASTMLKLGSGGRKKSRRSSWLPYEASRRLQRDAITGLALVFVSCLGLLLFGSVTNDFSVKFVDGLPQLSDGTPCQLLQVYPYDDPTAPTRAMVDCGDQAGIGVAGVMQHLFIALAAVGVLLLLSAVFALVLASRMPRESLAIPVCVATMVIGIISVWWGLKGGAPGLAFQGFRPAAVTGYLREGGSVTTRDGAVSWGVGLLAASFVRLTRP